MFLKQTEVDTEEEAIRLQIRNFSDERRAKIFAVFKHQLKDPDTYAALNWSFILGAHHFYLAKYWQVLCEWLLFGLGIILLINDFQLGVLFIVIISAFELYHLFRSQVIVQDFNNQLMKSIIQNISH